MCICTNPNFGGRKKIIRNDVLGSQIVLPESKTPGPVQTVPGMSELRTAGIWRQGRLELESGIGTVLGDGRMSSEGV